VDSFHRHERRPDRDRRRRSPADLDDGALVAPSPSPTDFTDHSSLIFDFNGRTYRDGDLGVSWSTGTSAVIAGTHEVVLFDPPNDPEIIQGTNELRIRAAKDRRGNALQQTPVTHLFAYDTEGPKVTGNEPTATLYDRRQKVFFTLNDNYAGVAPTRSPAVTSSGGPPTTSAPHQPGQLTFNSQSPRHLHAVVRLPGRPDLHLPRSTRPGTRRGTASTRRSARPARPTTPSPCAWPVRPRSSSSTPRPTTPTRT
jgi:hypothetical protein